ncbi:MAG TPA: UDP-N-acetylmuramoyl-L-alanine--D-glutamate ligase [Saprospiraceae bacterium]|nr:UDP-N-acetylmuramoyl-L-alanine--D-glutamate ligase [Saprospiraceae bacterium]
MIVILGGGESGIGAALLAKKRGLPVFVSDNGKIHDHFVNELVEAEIDFEQEGHDFIFDLTPELVVKSPGILDQAEAVIYFKEQSIEIISEIEFAFRYVNGILVGITGSNGKTTTTNLMYHLLHSARKDVVKCGNVGYSFARAVAGRDHSFYVIELSSFQLDGIVHFRPNIGILLNITPDHLDRYDNDFEKYISSKWRIFRNQLSEDYAIVNTKDKVLAETLSSQNLAANEIQIDASLNALQILKDHQEYLVNLSDSTLRGQHNAVNAACAIRAAQILGLESSSIQEAVTSFVNDPHRMELVLEHDGVRWINDSKATNVDSVYWALDSLSGNIIWIAGGLDKGNDYTAIQDLVRTKVKAIVALGKKNEAILTAFRDVVERVYDTHDMESAIKIVKGIAEFQDTVLLSPACASFDLFQNYEHRGNSFKDQIKKQIQRS